MSGLACGVFFFWNCGHTAIYEEPYDEHDYTNPAKRSSRAYCGNTAIGIVLGSIYYQCELLASCLFRLQCTVSIYKSSNPHCQPRSIDRWLGYSAALQPATVHAQPISSSSSRFRFLVFSFQTLVACAFPLIILFIIAFQLQRFCVMKLVLFLEMRKQEQYFHPDYFCFSDEGRGRALAFITGYILGNQRKPKYRMIRLIIV